MEIILIILAGALGVMVGYFIGAAKVALLKGDLADALDAQTRANDAVAAMEGEKSELAGRIVAVTAERDAAVAKLPVRGAGGKFVAKVPA